MAANVICQKCRTAAAPRITRVRSAAVSIALVLGGFALGGILMSGLFAGSSSSGTMHAGSTSVMFQDATPVSAPIGLGDLAVPFVLAFLPLLIYRALPFGETKRACAACGSADVVPADSPRGRELAGN